MNENAVVKSKETLSKVELASTVFSADKEHLRIAAIGIWPMHRWD